MRILLVGLFFMGSFATIVAKAVHLQVYRSRWLSQAATDQYEKSLTTSGKRGIIYDRNMREMAVSVKVTSIAAYPSRIKDIKASAQALAKILKLDAREIKKRLTTDKSFVWIKRKTTAKETSQVKQLNLPGIDFVQEFNRYYPNTTLAAQALGFTGLDGEGLEGIEFYYNRQLTGAHKNFTVFKDALGNEFNPENRSPATDGGHNLVLTID
ncbi:MAG: hypothetical protein P8X90_18660 [Desulfobacterales bacterium]